MCLFTFCADNFCRIHNLNSICYQFDNFLLKAFLIQSDLEQKIYFIHSFRHTVFLFACGKAKRHNAFPQNFCTRKLGKVTVFYVVWITFVKNKILHYLSSSAKFLVNEKYKTKSSEITYYIYLHIYIHTYAFCFYAKLLCQKMLKRHKGILLVYVLFS